ncbi:hypothetical protein KQI84_01970 [bacterium]|nr:hypothetical protein [bacterium]
MRAAWILALAVAAAGTSACAGTDKATSDTIEGRIVIPRIEASPTIDGRIAPGEYKGAFSLSLDGTSPDVNPGFNPFNADAYPSEDMSFTFYLAHDGEALYVAFNITDNSISFDDFPRPGARNASLWEDDCTEVFIDADFDRDRPSEGSNRRGPDGNWAEGAIPHYGIPDGTYWDGYSNLYGERPDGWFARAAVIDDHHWQTEYRFPFTGLDTADGPETRPLRPGDTIGMNVMVNDDDFGGTREHQLAWQGSDHTNELYKQQDAWVEVVIGE